MTPEARQQAAQHFWQHLDSGQLIAELPKAQRPQNEAEGHAIQATFAEHSSQPVAGWKIASSSKAGQEHLNVDGPLAGRYLAERLLPNLSTLSLASNMMRVVEAEFTFLLGRDLPPRDSVYDVQTVMSAVAELCPSLEVPDSRYSDFTKVGKAQLIADNALAWWLMIGNSVPLEWKYSNLSKHEVQLYRNGHLASEGVGANVLGDPREALTWLVNDVTSRGETLRRGQFVTTGTCHVPLVVEPADEILADYGVFGKLRMRIAE